MILERWAILHKPSGNFLPLTLRNHTEAEPQSDCVPRLFDSKQGASSALSRWLEGVWRLARYRSGYYGEEIEEDWGPEKPKNPRLKEEMEVVKIRIEIQVVTNGKG